MSKGPLLTLPVAEALSAGRDAMAPYIECSLDLGRSQSRVQIFDAHWAWEGREFPYPARSKERTIYYWSGTAFEPAARFSGSLVKLVPTEWGAPTFEIDGIKMLPSAQVSPFEDAQRKVELIKPRGKEILDTCGGLGYFASWCLQGGARQIVSFEKNPDVLWLRDLNPWSPAAQAGVLTLTVDDVAARIGSLGDGSFDAILHDPPRFGIAGELYSQVFYDQLARVLKRKGLLFHYTGSPNKLTSNRDVPNEVATRLRRSSFRVRAVMDGVLAEKP